jgi:hypothetical protein
MNNDNKNQKNINELEVQRNFDLSFPDTIEKIIFKIILIIIINIILFTIFNPYYYKTKRRIFRLKDYSYVIYMALISTISTIILAIIYMIYNNKKMK